MIPWPMLLFACLEEALHFETTDEKNLTLCLAGGHILLVSSTTGLSGVVGCHTLLRVPWRKNPCFLALLQFHVVGPVPRSQTNIPISCACGFVCLSKPKDPQVYAQVLESDQAP